MGASQSKYFFDEEPDPQLLDDLLIGCFRQRGQELDNGDSKFVPACEPNFKWLKPTWKHCLELNRLERSGFGQRLVL